jgi:hypothetical protein
MSDDFGKVLSVRKSDINGEAFWCSPGNVYGAEAIYWWLAFASERDARDWRKVSTADK